MPPIQVVIRDVDAKITTFTTPFNRFAPFGYRKFVAVGNRATAVRLHDNRILLLNPIPLDPSVHDKLNSLGGVHLIAADLGHHMYVQEYLHTWPSAKALGVPGLDNKRQDIKWSFIYNDWRAPPEQHFDFAHDIETVLFQGFITYAVAWFHKPSQTLIQSDLMMNLPCTEQYTPSSAHQGPGSRAFANRAHPRSVWAKRLVYHIATVDFTLMRRDAKRVAEWEIQRIIPCHGDVIERGGNEAWATLYEWYLASNSREGLGKKLMTPVMKVARWMFLM
ncbi:hypothetical protein ACN47E_000771 [Coniothyrium glycines]